MSHKISAEWIHNVITMEIYRVAEDPNITPAVVNRVFWHLMGSGLLRMDRLTEDPRMRDVPICEEGVPRV